MSHYYALVDEGRTLLLAAGFGFGSRVAAQMLMRRLGMPRPQWRSISDQPPSPDSSEGAFKALINFGVVDDIIAHIPALSRVWIDCIAWLRSTVPHLVADYDLLLGERFFPIPAAQESQPQSIAVCPLLTRPAFQRQLNKSAHSARRVVVSFGGIATPFSATAHHTKMPVAVLLALAESNRVSAKRARITCFLPPALHKQCAGMPALSGLDLRVTNARAYRSAVEDCDLLILQPGLYGPFEAFAAEIPVDFTFPMSYTQACQAMRYRKDRVFGTTNDWEQACELFDCRLTLAAASK